MLSDHYSKLPTPVEDVVFQLDGIAKAAPEPKANLVIGAYRDANGKPYPLRTVRKAEQRILDMALDKEYLPIAGFQPFCDESLKMLFAKDLPSRGTIASVHTLSGTGACRVGAEFFARTTNVSTTHVYLSNPTWANHGPIFANSGFKNIKYYRYFDPKTNGVAIKEMLEDLQTAPEKSIVVLHQVAHNPTGADPTPEEWERIAGVLKAKQHYVFFDSAYQGYASGSLDKDAFAARLFARKKFEFVVAQSYAKNMGLYNERVGCLSVITASEASAKLVLGLLKNIIRPMYSNPPAHGARVAHLILTDPSLRAEWEAELKTMADRIVSMRKMLFDELVRLKTPGKWDHITKQIGMFSYLGLTKEQCQELHKRRVFIMLTGRASIAGLTAASVKFVAQAIDEVVRMSSHSKL